MVIFSRKEIGAIALISTKVAAAKRYADSSDMAQRVADKLTPVSELPVGVYAIVPLTMDDLDIMFAMILGLESSWDEGTPEETAPYIEVRKYLSRIYDKLVRMLDEYPNYRMLIR